jgi:phosphatidylglycerol:prolipoprotein diacylglycerol transferase
VVGGLVGARLFHVVDRWDLYAADPLSALSVWQGGLAVYGGLIGGVLAGLAYAVRHGLPAWRLADAAAPGMILGQALGRLACIPNGDAYGAPAHVPWAFIYTHPGAMVPRELLGVPTHPYPAYELLFDAALFALLWRLRGVFKTDGALFLIYAALYAVGRFLLTFSRMERVWLWGLQEAQVIALLALGAALPLLLWRLWAGRGAPRGGLGAAAAPD